MKTDWIKVSESLPLDGQEVFVMVSYKGQLLFLSNMYFADDDVWMFGDDPVIAWIPIPNYDEFLKLDDMP